MNYETVQKSSQSSNYMQQNLDQDQNAQYFIDRQYRRNKLSYDRRDEYRRDEFRAKSDDIDKFRIFRFLKSVLYVKNSVMSRQ